MPHYSKGALAILWNKINLGLNGYRTQLKFKKLFQVF